MKFKTVVVASFIVFVLGSCKSKDTGVLNADTVLVQLNKSESVIDLENEFSVYSLQKIKIVSRPMHIFLFEYNQNKIADTSLIKLLRKSSFVKEAQQNSDVTLRKTEI